MREPILRFVKRQGCQTDPTVFMDISEELLEGMLICLDWDALRSECREQVLCGISCELARAAAADDNNGDSHLHGARRRQVTGGALRKIENQVCLVCRQFFLVALTSRLR